MSSLFSIVAPFLGWLPSPVIGALSGSLTSANDVQVSNMPGVTPEVVVSFPGDISVRYSP